MSLDLIATCGLGLEEILEQELLSLRARDVRRQRGAVAFRGGLRAANRVLVVLGTWDGSSSDALAAGARALVRRRRSEPGIDAGALLDPKRTFSIRATTRASRITDLRWAALKVKDGLVDGQRDRHRRRGYRVVTADAPVREDLAAACVLAAGWDGRGPVVDPMCGSGTLLAEAAGVALGRAPGFLRGRAATGRAATGRGDAPGWAFERFPSFDVRAFAAVRREPIPAPGPDVELFGVDRSPAAMRAVRANLARADLGGRARLERGDGFDFEPPPAPGLFLVNPAYGERLEEEPQQWKRLGDLLKQRYAGWRAVVLAGGETLGKPIGLKPSRRIPVRNGPLEARILIFEIY